MKESDDRDRGPAGDMGLADIGEYGFAAVAAVLARYRRSILLVLGLLTALSLLLSVLLPPMFRARCIIIPSSYLASESLGGGIGLLQRAARQFGSNLGADSQGDRSYLFPLIIESRQFLEELLAARTPFEDRTSLLDHLDIDADGERKTLEEATERLRRKMLRIVYDAQSGASKIYATTKNSELSAWLANFVVAKLDSQLVEMRTDLAGDKAEFIANRLRKVENDLDEAESSLRTFRERNRATSSSPELMLQESRLMRDVELNQALFIELTTQEELAKIEQLRTLPDVVLVESAVPPVRRHSPRPFRWTLTGLLLGLMVGLGQALVRDQRREQQERRPNRERTSNEPGR